MESIILIMGLNRRRRIYVIARDSSRTPGEHLSVAVDKTHNSSSQFFCLLFHPCASRSPRPRVYAQAVEFFCMCVSHERSSTLKSFPDLGLQNERGDQKLLLFLLLPQRAKEKLQVCSRMVEAGGREVRVAQEHSE